MIEHVIPRLWRFTRRTIGVRGLAMMSLLLAAQITLLLSLTRVVRGLDDWQGWLTLTSVFAIWLGWETGRKSINGGSGWGLGILSGVFIHWVHLSEVGQPLYRLINSILYRGRVLMDRSLSGELAQIAYEINWFTYSEALNKVFDPLLQWWGGVMVGEVAYNKVVTLLFWGILLWLLAFWSGWSLRRLENPLLTLLPQGTLLAGSYSYTGQTEFIGLAGFVGVMFLVMGVNGQYFRERGWIKRQLDYAEDLRLDALIAVSMVAVVLTVVAATSSFFSVEQFRTWYRSYFTASRSAENTRGRFGESLGIEFQEPTPEPDARLAGGLPRLHLLGSGPELEREVVMRIEVDDPAAELSPRYYWRSLTYDSYKGLGWETGETTVRQYADGDPIIKPGGQSQRTIRQHVEILAPQNNFIFANGEISTLDWPFSISWRDPLEGGALIDQFAGTVTRDDYQVDSISPLVSASQLRAASPILPDWVRARYLTLPDGIPDRVYDLAYGFGVGRSTNYDMAVAIETYLRTFPYTLDIPAPPADRDVVDYFLFDLQTGYCDYYASAMVVLARASGIPARLVVGYATGTYDVANDRYIVTAADAHSWVEIYFSGFGWVPFEPTGGQPELVRTETLPQLSSSVVVPPSPFKPIWMRVGVQIGWGVAGVLASVMLGIFAWSLFDAWRFNQLPPDEAVAKIFLRLKPAGHRLEVPSQTGDTPYEFAKSFTRRVVDLFPRQKFLSPARAEIKSLTEYYVRAAYAPHPLTKAERSTVLKIWRLLRVRLWWAGFLLRLQWRKIKK